MGHLGGPGGRILLLLIETPMSHWRMIKATRAKEKRVETKVERSMMTMRSPQEKIKPKIPIVHIGEDGSLGQQFMVV